MISSVLTVSQVNTFVKSLIDGDGRLNDFFLSGEISNFTDHYRSGHLYFSIKDEKSVLKAVMFSSAAQKLKFKPENGLKVIVRGRISVYEASGQYQMYVQSMQPDGLGALSIAFEQLKTKLMSEGLFDEEYKKKIPQYPQKIGVITSPTGAAVQDILQILNRRWPLAEVVFCPTLVQGETAGEQITKALQSMDTSSGCDVIILGRGGGSYEDLQAFNDEQLARTIFACNTPIISAVGHETDFTISDFVADLRAPTPSAAAELCTPSQDEILAQLSSYHQFFSIKAQQEIEHKRQMVDYLWEESLLSNPEKIFLPLAQKLAELTDTNQMQIKLILERQKNKLENQAIQLESLSPLKVLIRGYAVVQDSAGNLIKSARKSGIGDDLKIRFADGKINVKVIQ